MPAPGLPSEPAPTSEPAPAVETERPPIRENDGPTLRAPFRSKEIVIDIPGERSRNNKLVLGALTTLAAAAGGIGLYYHLDSRSASNEISADVFTGFAWSDRHEGIAQRAERSKTRAAIGYSVGGAFLTAAIVYLFVTEPKTEQMIIQPQASVQPTAGGAVVGGVWSF